MEQLSFSLQTLLLIVAWTLPWKAVALWKAAKNSQQRMVYCLISIEHFGNSGNSLYFLLQ